MSAKKPIRPGDYMPQAARADFLAPIVLECVDESAENNQTLALIRPEQSEFRYKRNLNLILNQKKKFTKIQIVRRLCLTKT